MTFFYQIFDETLSDLASKKKSYGIKIQNQEFGVRIAIIRSNGWGTFRVLGSKMEKQGSSSTLRMRVQAPALWAEVAIGLEIGTIGRRRSVHLQSWGRQVVVAWILGREATH